MESLTEYTAKSGTLLPVFTLEVQTLPEDTDRILDEVMKVNPLNFGRHPRNALGRAREAAARGRETLGHDGHARHRCNLTRRVLRDGHEQG